MQEMRREVRRRVRALMQRLGRVADTEADKSIAVTALVLVAVDITRRVKGVPEKEARSLVAKIATYEEASS